MSAGIEIRGPRLLLRALRASEIDEEWQAMVNADPMVIAALPDEGRSGPGCGDRAVWSMASSTWPSTWTGR